MKFVIHCLEYTNDPSGCTKMMNQIFASKVRLLIALLVMVRDDFGEKD